MESVHSARLSDLDGAAAWAFAVDGLTPRFVAAPRSAGELAEVLREAAQQGWAVCPRGGGTKMSRGNPPRALDLLLDLRDLSGIVEYTPADMTVTVHAGTPLAVLQADLAAQGQMLALDPPFATRATIGGILAANDSGPRRLGYGTARDVVIGTRVATMDGRVTRAGGKVVKNVTGYDLNKLYIGSLGTLAALAEVSFRLHPLPVRTRTIGAIFGDVESAMSAVAGLTRSPLGPIALALAGDAAAGDDAGTPAQLYVEFTGGPSALQRKCADALRLCHERGALAALALPEGDAAAAWQAAREHPATYGQPEGLRLKAAVSVSAVAGLIGAATKQTRALGLECRWLAFAGNGILYIYLNGGSRESYAACVGAWRGRAVAAGGSLVVEEAPTALKSAIDVWGQPPSGFGLMRRLKQTYDPLGLLNPGRYVGGL